MNKNKKINFSKIIIDVNDVVANNILRTKLMAIVTQPILVTKLQHLHISQASINVKNNFFIKGVNGDGGVGTLFHSSNDLIDICANIQCTLCKYTPTF